MKKTNEIHWGRPIIATSLLIILIISVSYGVIEWINHREEEISFDRLYEEAGKISNHLNLHVNSDQEELEMTAELISQYDSLESPDIRDILDSYEAVGMISKIELLLPGDVVLSRGGERTDVKGTLSFEQEAALGAHISARETDWKDGSYIVRHYVPVKKDGRTVAMLYGVILLETLPEKLAEDPYDGKAAVYIIDGKNGDFLVDTWHSDGGGNIWALGEREMAPGYDHEQLKQGLTNGESAYVVFVSETAGEYLYFYYEPIEINEWRIALSVPESIVFENADEIKEILNFILVFEMFCFILYFLWILHYVRSETSEKQHKLEMMNYMYDVEKLLFNAHEKQENVVSALGKIAHILSAERVGLWVAGRNQDDFFFQWKNGGQEETADAEARKADMQMLLEYFEKGNSVFEADGTESVREKLPGSTQKEIDNMAAVPVEDIEGGICGILLSCNVKGKKADASLLERVKFSFGMFCYNLTTFNTVKKQGEKDMLTGVYNRNRYETDIASIERKYKKSLACIFIDVNGLHELNNTKGHGAGDTMLKEVAAQICRRFGTELTYRIGGDEFLIFVPDRPEEEVYALCRELESVLEKEDYHISVGIQWETDTVLTASLIKAAEKKMYAAKKKYYEQEGNDRRKRGSR